MHELQPLQFSSEGKVHFKLSFSECGKHCQIGHRCKGVDSMDKNVSMYFDNQEEKVPGPPVNETYETLMGLNQEPSREELEGEVRRCICLFSIMFS